MLSACLLLPGTRLDLRQAARLLGATTGPFIAHVLSTLEDAGHADTVLHVLTTLAAHLDQTAVPINYQRRRDQLAHAPLLSLSHWTTLCQRVGVPAGTRRHIHAQRYAYELLTGNAAHAAPPPLRLDDGPDTSSYHRFRDRAPAELTSLLHTHAQHVLHDNGINEPLTWEPPLHWITNPVAWPGPDPEAIDLDELARLVNQTPRLATRDIAKQLGTTPPHVSYTLQHNALVRPPGHNNDARRSNQALPRSGPLDSEHVRLRYENDGWSWQQIADEAGCSKSTAMNIGHSAGITSRPSGRQRHLVDPAWLRHAYLVELRTFPDIAAELGMSPQAIRMRARALGIPSRPRGGSHRTTPTRGPRPTSRARAKDTETRQSR